MEARVRWANPRLKLNKQPNKGRPLGPKMGTEPTWFLPFFQAKPPVGTTHVKRQTHRNAIKTEIKSQLLNKFWVSTIAGSVNTHQLVSRESIEVKSITLNKQTHWVLKLNRPLDKKRYLYCCIAVRREGEFGLNSCACVKKKGFDRRKVKRSYDKKFRAKFACNRMPTCARYILFFI